MNSEVELVREGDLLTVKARSGSRFATAVSGTTRALLANMIQGVTEGFEKKLELRGSAIAALGNLLSNYKSPLLMQWTAPTTGI
jgi:ribosomal protein L6P/L9E